MIQKLLELLDTVLLDGCMVIYRIGSIIINIIKPAKDPLVICEYPSPKAVTEVHFYDDSTGRYLGRSVDNGNGVFCYFDDAGREIGHSYISGESTEYFENYGKAERVVIQYHRIGRSTSITELEYPNEFFEL